MNELPDFSRYEALAGTILNQEQFAGELGTTLKGVRSALQDQRIVGFKVGSPRVLHIPQRFLIEAHRSNPADVKPAEDDGKLVILPSLQGTIIMLKDMSLSDWEILTWLFTENSYLSDTPINLLHAGNRSAVRRAAHDLL